MGAVRMRVQTADKNITIIHTTPGQQLTSCEVKSALSSENAILSESGQKYAQIKHYLQDKIVQKISEYVGGF